jgi:oxygen-independent coproporphyrinogen-3 oxidase
MDLGIYIHIPFCLHKCPYCDFNSITVKPLPEEKYVKALVDEIRDRAEGFKRHTVETIYLGGGTPSLFSPQSIGVILDEIAKNFTLDAPLEITIEANPNSLTQEKLSIFHALGINRLSLGVQSFKDDCLKTLGRIHTSQDAILAFDAARKGGFENIGIDLIFSIPSQTTRDWEEDLDKVIDFHPEHISTYQLHIEEGTPFYQWVAKEELSLPSEKLQTEMFETTWAKLKQAGYEHYEISNFALPGFRSRHNQRYWEGKEYLGIGAGAHSFLQKGWGMRRANITNPLLYMDSAERTEYEEHLKKEEAIEEAIFLGLRQREGIDLKLFQERFGVTLNPYFTSLQGLVKEEMGCLKFTPRGLLLSNEVFLRLMP